MQSRGLALLCGALLLALATVSCSRDPKTAARSYVETGNKFYNNGKKKQARIMYARAISRDKLNGEAYYRLGITEFELGNIMPALQSFRRAVDLLPKGAKESIDAHSRLADIYLGAIMYDRAHADQYVGEMKTLADSLLKLDPNSFAGLRIRGFVNLGATAEDAKRRDAEAAKEHMNLAIADFLRANSIQPNNPELVTVLVQALAGANRFEEGEKLARGLIAVKKDYPNVYDVLYLEYMKRNRMPDAEAVLKEKAAANPKEIDFRLQLAGLYFIQRDRAKTDAELMRVQSDFQKDPKMREKVGQFYFRIRDLQLAYDQFALGAKEQPKRAGEFKRSMVECLVAQNKRPEAMGLVEEILKADATDDTAKALRAALLLQSGKKDDVDKSVAEMQALVGRMGDNAVLRFNYGRALLAQGKIDQAAVQFEESKKYGQRDYMLPRMALAEIAFNKGEYQKALAQCDEILQADPMNIVARLIRARAQFAVGDPGKARQELTALAEQNPRLFDAHYQLAVLNLQERNYAGAEQILQRLFKDTGDNRALFALAETYAQQRRFDDALNVLQAQLQKDPKRGDLLVAIGNAAAQASKTDLAIQHYSKAVELYPNNGDAYLRLGEVYRITGNMQKATETFRKAAQTLPNDFRPALQLAILLDVTGDKKSAKKGYEDVLKARPDQEIALNNLAFILAEEGSDLDRALGMAQRAQQRQPNMTDIADTLGWIYLKKNLSDSALPIFEELVRKRPENATYRYHLALALFQKGDKAKAKKEASAALQAKPAKDEETRIRELLSKIG